MPGRQCLNAQDAEQGWPGEPWKRVPQISVAHRKKMHKEFWGAGVTLWVLWGAENQCGLCASEQHPGFLRANARIVVEAY